VRTLGTAFALALASTIEELKVATEILAKLEDGSSDEVISRNIKELVDSGYPQDQAEAIAYKHAGRAREAKSVEATVLQRAAVGFGDTDVERGPDGAPVAFRMWHAGMNRTDKGDHKLTSDSVRRLLATQSERGNRFSIDVDHMSLDSSAPPENHKAVGWFDIEERDGDLWAVNVEWTEAVRSGFAGPVPEWRYFSPAYETRKDSGEIVRLLNLALTNNPATHHVTALATSASRGEEAAMADDKEKKEESLAAMLAAYDDEKDEDKKAKMKASIKAKFKAAFGDDEKSDEKKDEGEKKEAKKASEDAPPPEKKETTKADAADGDAEKMAASIAAKAETIFETKRREREETVARDRILASLPTGDRETYKDLSLAQLERIVKRHHSDVLERHAATASAQPTRGATHGQRTSMLSSNDREALDAEMGLVHRDGYFVKEEGTTLEFNPWASREDIDRTLASIKEARKTGAKNDGEALSLVLANQKGAAR